MLPSFFLLIGFEFTGATSFAKRNGKEGEFITQEGIRQYFSDRIANKKNTLVFGDNDGVSVTWKPSQDPNMFYCVSRYEGMYVQQASKDMMGRIYADLFSDYAILTAQFKMSYLTLKTIDLHLDKPIDLRVE